MTKPESSSIAADIRSFAPFRGRAVGDAQLLAGCALLMAVYYTALVGLITRFHLIEPVMFGMSFNSMLDHLLHGRFDVDPKAISTEAFVRNGRSYAYFGILPALLRAPLIPFGKLLSVDVTRVSCVAAAWVCGFINLLTLVRVHARTALPRRGPVFWSFAVTVMFGAPQVSFLMPSIYQEAELWGTAWASIFVYCALDGLVVRREFSNRLLISMSVVAGLALLTRVTFGLALYVSLCALLSVLLVQDARPGGAARFRRFVQLAASPRILLPLGVLSAFAVLCGIVNEERFGSPTAFVDM